MENVPGTVQMEEKAKGCLYLSKIGYGKEGMELHFIE